MRIQKRQGITKRALYFDLSLRQLYLDNLNFSKGNIKNRENIFAVAFKNLSHAFFVVGIISNIIAK